MVHYFSRENMNDYSKKFLENDPLVQKKIEIIRNWVEKHGQIWARRALYELVSKQLIKDTSNYSYTCTCKLFQNLREYGMIPYEWFKDKRTKVENVDIDFYGEFQDRFAALCKYYPTSRSSKELQKNYVEIWTEKELSEDTVQLIEQYDVGLVMGEGFIGDIPFHDATERVKRILNKYELPVRIFYISDYDCEGAHTFNLCKAMLEPIGDVEVKKLFLVKEQVEKYRLIPNIGYRERMLKPKVLKNHLAKQYVKEFFKSNTDLKKDGIVQYELDQVDILIRNRVKIEIMKKSLADTISSFIDLDVINNTKERCEREVKEWVSKHYRG